MEYSFFVTNVVKQCGQARFLPDFEQKNSGRFRGGADTPKPEKARKIKKNRESYDSRFLV